MSRQLVLLRGINVGGHNKLPMVDLMNILNDLGASEVRTYIQSGNAVMRGDVTADAVSQAIEAAKGFCPKVMVISHGSYSLIAKANPYPEAEIEGKTLHIWFLSRAPQFDFKHADALVKSSERYHVTEAAIYLHAPDGIGRSKLAAAMEKIAGVPATARNWNTVVKLLALANP